MNCIYQVPQSHSSRKLLTEAAVAVAIQSSAPPPPPELYDVFYNPTAGALSNGNYALLCSDRKANTLEPTVAPTNSPTDAPTFSPTDSPTDAPTDSPTTAPTNSPTDAPTFSPTDSPTQHPTNWMLHPANEGRIKEKAQKSQAASKERAQKHAVLEQQLKEKQEKKYARDRKKALKQQDKLTASKQRLLADMTRIVMLHKMCKDEDPKKLDMAFIREQLETVRLSPQAAAAAMQKAALVKTLEKMMIKFSTLHQLNAAHAEYEMKDMAYELLETTKKIREHASTGGVKPLEENI